MRFSAEQLRERALAVLEEAASQSRSAPLDASRAAGLRFALAHLSNAAADRSPFDEFWRVVTGAADAGINPTMVDMLRKSKADQALGGIYQQVGLRRQLRG